MKRQPGQQQFLGEVLVERQQRILEVLRTRASRPMTGADLAEDLGVSQRTIERDIARLRDAGLPIEVTSGPGGGYRFAARSTRLTIELTPGEAAALIAAMSTVGPSSTATAQHALAKLVDALTDASGKGRAGKVDGACRDERNMRRSRSPGL
jgi:predicted DNA-binding transcriptional regulator YafY